MKDGLPNETLLKTVFWGTASSLKTGQWADCCCLYINVIPQKWYMFSAYAQPYRCNGFLLVEEMNAKTDQWVREIARSKRLGDIEGGDHSGSFQDGLKNAPRDFVKFQAPASGRIRLAFRIDMWRGYNPDAYFARPMLEECTAYTREPSPWQNSGITAIHGGSIATATITAQQLAAGSVTTEKLVAGAVNARHIASNSIHTQHIYTRSINADKLNIQSLSAISANLGTITAGSININNRFKVNTNGQVEMRSATNNVGLVMNNDQILVYDERGRIRVKIGRL